MSTKFDRKIKKKFFVPLIAKNWNNNNYYSDDNNQKKKKNFTLRTNRNRNLFPSSSYFPKYTKEHSNKITGQYQQNSKTENPSILADASFEDGKVEISLSLSLFPSSRFTSSRSLPFVPFSLSPSLSPSLSLTLSLYSSIAVSLGRSLRGASQFRDTKRPGSIESSSSSLEFFTEWADSWRTPEGIEEAFSLSLSPSPLFRPGTGRERNRLERD